jgi:renalase
MNHVAVVGAGIAGLAAAHRLEQLGFDITLFEKSRGVGGRMATRAVGDLQFDYGAQYFTARGKRFLQLVESWKSQGQVAEWFPDAFVGSPGMNEPAKEMARGKRVVARCHVTRLKRGARGWSILAEDRLVATPGNGEYSAVILAIPAPQALPFALAAGAELAASLATVRYAPCWALMLAFPVSLNLSEDRYKPEDDAIAWVSRNSSKPGRDSEIETIVVHATSDWSREHLESSPEAVAKVLEARLRKLTGRNDEARFSTAHHWRYAMVERTASAPCLWDAAVGLGSCGDWCLGPRVEAAFESGCHMADAVAQSRRYDLVV